MRVTVVADADFEEFWQAFPKGRKKNKKAARTAYRMARRRAEKETLLAAAVEYAQSEEGRGAYVKMPSTWLNGDCWEDERFAWGRPQTPPPPPSRSKQQRSDNEEALREFQQTFRRNGQARAQKPRDGPQTPELPFSG